MKILGYPKIQKCRSCKKNYFEWVYWSRLCGRWFKACNSRTCQECTKDFYIRLRKAIAYTDGFEDGMEIAHQEMELNLLNSLNG